MMDLGEEYVCQSGYCCHRLPKAPVVESCTPVNPWEVGQCIEWLQENPRKLKGQHSSYTLKHMVEEDEGLYISNGAMIVAARGLGFRMKKEPPGVVFRGDAPAVYRALNAQIWSRPGRKAK